MRTGTGIILWLALCLAGSAAEQSVVVGTASGKLAGRRSEDGRVVSFKGVPFAAPPVGELRWKPPQPVAAWSEVRDAGSFGASCVQHEREEFLPWTAEYLTHNRVSEDCLYLNIWTPRVEEHAGLPVIVFIHGGGFTEGAGDVAVYDGEHLAQRGVVLVTINYRLGVFGFLAHPELTAESAEHSSGNYALLDQIAALGWVRQNIRAFGGDSGRVTIWGQSAGAFSVGALIASPLASGRFERAVADSGLGVAGMPMMSLAAAEKAGAEFAAAHHANTLRELRALPAEELLGNGQGNGPRFGPIVDGWVLPDSPNARSAKGADSDVPVVTGYQANDGLLFLPATASADAFHKLAERQYGELAAEFEKLYAPKDGADSKSALIEAARDRERVSMFLWASRREKNHRQPVFLYYFDRAIPWPQHPEFGAFHSGELPYFFGNLDQLERPWEEQDRRLSEMVQTYLKNFAANGDPNGGGVPEWKRAERGKPVVMELGARMGPMPLADKQRLDFWVRYFDSPAAAHAPVF